MNEFVITFIGIVLFVASEGTNPADPRVAVLPKHTADGKHQGKPVHAHTPFIAFEPEHAGQKVTWSGFPKDPDSAFNGAYKYFVLPDGFTVSVNAQDDTLVVDDTHYGARAAVPRVRAHCPDFEFDATKPTVATVPINVGRLSGKLDGNWMAYSEWTVKANGSLVITIAKGNDKRRITLPKGAIVYIGNSTAEYLRTADETVPADKRNHWYIYYKMDANTNACTAKPSDLFKPMKLHAQMQQMAKGRDSASTDPRASHRDRDTDADCSNSNYP